SQIDKLPELRVRVTTQGEQTFLAIQAHVVITCNRGDRLRPALANRGLRRCEIGPRLHMDEHSVSAYERLDSAHQLLQILALESRGHGLRLRGRRLTIHKFLVLAVQLARGSTRCGAS